MAVASRLCVNVYPMIRFCLVAGLVLAAAAASAQEQTSDTPAAPPSTAPPSTLVYSNRDIVELRAGLLGRTPAERAAAAFERLDAIAEAGPDGPVSSVIVENVGVISVGTQNAFVVVPADLDELRGETLQQKVSLAAARLQTAMDEQTELRSPARVAWGALQSLIATVVFVPLLWTIVRTHRVLVVRVPETAEQQLQKISASHLQLVRASHAPEILRHAVTAAAVIAGLVLSYVWLTFVLRRFPYTRPWGESLREFLLARLLALGLAVVHAVPDLFTVLVIVLITRFAVRLTYLAFDAVEQERLTLPGVFPETAQPTRRLVTTLMWLLALIASYPYLPGSDSDAFKGVSVFVGLVVSLGSSGIVNQVMSGMTLTYSRALRLGDFVRIGDIEGTVTHLGNLSTKVKTPAREDITIPNAVVVSTPITNYSRFAAAEGVLVPTTVTIGYAVPWRQVHALLLLAAERTAGIRRTPLPIVRQANLRDFHVEYVLLVCLEQPHLRYLTLGALRANIQDAFNEFGVQIMAPNYEADPEAPKIVPRDKWFAAPATSLEAKATGGLPEGKG